MTRKEVASLIERFIDGSSSEWEWDDFISIVSSDDQIEDVRRSCSQLADRYPPVSHGQYCSPKGIEELRSLIASLRR